MCRKPLFQHPDLGPSLFNALKVCPRPVWLMGASMGLMDGNLRPLLNGESLKNWPNGEFEKKDESNMVHFQTDV